MLAAVDHGIERGLVDGERLGVGGWPYGGILTNYVITQTRRFRAASSGANPGRETQVVVYPGEHHGIRRPSFVRDRYERWLAWFDRYLKDPS